MPQNIMDVEFKLFGSLTVRQFANLAGSIVVAVILYFFNIPGIIKWPAIVGFVFLGISLALVKINGQTFGTWLGNFLASMFSSQRKIWKKDPKVPEILTKTYRPRVSNEQLVSAKKKELPPFLREDIIQSTNVVDEEEEERLKKLEKYILGGTSSTISEQLISDEEKAQRPVIIDPSDQNLAGTMNTANEDNYSINQSDEFAVIGKKMANQRERPISSRLVHKNLAENIGIAVSEDTKESGLGKEKEKKSEIGYLSEKPVNDMNRGLDVKRSSSDELIEANKILQERIQELTEKAKKSPDDSQIAQKLAEMEKRLVEIQSGGSFANEKIVSQKPNVISGIVTDKENKLLPDVRVLIKDRRGFLVRSLITDKQGYFVTTTSLPDGDYLVEFESDRHPFDQYKVNLNGSLKDTYKFTAR